MNYDIITKNKSFIANQCMKEWGKVSNIPIRHCYPDPDDYVQEVLTILCARLHSSDTAYDPEKGAETTWLGYRISQIAWELFRTHLYDKRKVQFQVLAVEDLMPDSGFDEIFDGGVNPIADHEKLMDAHRVLLAATKGDSTAMLVADYTLQGYAQTEIAKELDIPRHRVSTILKNILKNATK